MNKSRITLIVIFAVVGVLLLLYFFLGDDGKRYQWFENYRAQSDQPYGTSVIRKMLEGYRPGSKFIYNDRQSLRLALDSTSGQRTDYVFIGHNLHLSPLEMQALRDFIQAGNDAFIACQEVPEFVYQIYDGNCDDVLLIESNASEIANLNFYHNTLRTDKGYDFRYRFHTEDVPYPWGFLNTYSFCDSTTSLTPLGTIQQAGTVNEVAAVLGNATSTDSALVVQPDSAAQSPQVNFVRIDYGRGHLYLHTNPLAFTNYFMIQRDKMEYASGVFSHLRGKDIIWDEFSKLMTTSSDNPYNSPLYHLLEQPSLKYAWWMMLGTVLLYVLFAARRRQRVIPVLEPKANTSFEFVNLVSALHYQNSDHLDIARKKMRYFLYFIRAKYGVHAQMFGPVHMRKLSERSGVPESDIRTIFDQYNLIESQAQFNTALDKLVSLYHAIEHFYKTCK